jgi:hypothetical protein
MLHLRYDDDADADADGSHQSAHRWPTNGLQMTQTGNQKSNKADQLFG